MRKINNDFEIDMLIVERVKNKFLIFNFFLKDIENTENDTNTSKIYFLTFCCFFTIFLFF